MDRDQIEKSEFVSSLSQFDSMSFKICLEKNGEAWEVTQIIGDLNSPKTKSPSYAHYYGNVIFVQGICSIQEFGTWITDLKGRLGNVCFLLPESYDQVRRERYSTGFAGSHFYRLPYPFTLYSMS